MMEDYQQEIDKIAYAVGMRHGTKEEKLQEECYKLRKINLELIYNMDVTGSPEDDVQKEIEVLLEKNYKLKQEFFDALKKQNRRIWTLLEYNVAHGGKDPEFTYEDLNRLSYKGK